MNLGLHPHTILEQLLILNHDYDSILKGTSILYEPHLNLTSKKQFLFIGWAHVTDMRPWLSEIQMQLTLV
jgi:hypothetical protein